MLGLWLIALHMLGDFILQNAWMSANKLADWRVRTIHVATYTVPFAIFAIFWLPAGHGSLLKLIYFTVSVFVLHWLTDSKRFCTSNPWPAKPIMVDQTLHLLQLAVCGSLFL